MFYVVNLKVKLEYQVIIRQITSNYFILDERGAEFQQRLPT